MEDLARVKEREEIIFLSQNKTNYKKIHNVTSTHEGKSNCNEVSSLTYWPSTKQKPSLSKDIEKLSFLHTC